MRILYVGHTRFPTEKAHGKQIAEVCSAMAAIGHEVTLVTSGVYTPIKESPFQYYGIPENFRWEKLQSFDALHHPLIPQPLAFMLGMWSYRKALRSYLQNHHFDLLYCRSQAVLSVLLGSGMPSVIELHTLPGTMRKDFLRSCNRCARVVCLTSPMRQELFSAGVSSDRVIVEGDAVRADLLIQNHSNVTISKVPVIGYVGSLVARNSLEKGVNVLIDALSILRKKGVSIRGLIAGGPKSWQEKYEEKSEKLGISSHVSFLGHIPSSRVPEILSQCDILVYPAPRNFHPYFLRDTSPLKIFEYMASGIPIVTADLPPIHDILDETMATFCKPGDSEDLARAIEYVMNHRDEAKQKADTAKNRVKEHTWEKRMERILLGLSQSSHHNSPHG